MKTRFITTLGLIGVMTLATLSTSAPAFADEGSPEPEAIIEVVTEPVIEPVIEPAPEPAPVAEKVANDGGNNGGGEGTVKVAVCHMPGTPAQQTLFVDDDAVPGHLGHGDNAGDCIALPPPPPPPVDTGATKTLQWLLPDGGTADNVTWPQTPYTGQLPECDTSLTIQVDVYRYGTPAQVALVDSFDDDGFLMQGEDYSSTISWSFITLTGAECETELIIVTPLPPQFFDLCGTDNDVMVLPDVTEADGYFYFGDDDRPTSYANIGALEGFAFPEGTKTAYEFTFTDVPCAVEPPIVIEPPVVIPPAVIPPLITPVIPAAHDHPAPVTSSRLADTGGDLAPMGYAIGLLLAGAGLMTLRRKFSH